MNAFRLFMIAVIYVIVSIGWVILGSTIYFRTESQSDRLGPEVDARWGPSGLVQPAPSPDPVESTVTVDLNHQDRYMGLVWFSTYTAEFTGTYKVARPANRAAPAAFTFPLPGKARVFENLSVTFDGQALDVTDAKHGNEFVVPLPAGPEEHTVVVTYRTQGRDRWVYDFAGSGDETAVLKKFSLTATTNFVEIDYPKGSASPTPEPAKPVPGGMEAEWRFENRSTRQQIGIEMPARVNAGPIVGRMSFFAPVSLLFFFTVLFTIVVLRKVPLHPMHYLFVSAGFFAFHILLAYLVDKIDIHYAFWICAAVSVFLVVNYMRMVAGVKFAVVYVGVAQLVYLIGFSYAFFWPDNTGLTVVIVAVITLAVLMVATARVAWDEVFAQPAVPPGPRVPPAV
ncbi:MAG TPA: inner membrane CreD family protein [Phycisphaerae bacterium]|nr:inner membrane CreD family protein [Phycisphaerae bacterium]